MPQDKFGIPFFYPTKTTAGVSGKGVGFFWQQAKDIFDDNDNGMVRLGKEHDDVEVISTSTGEWEFPYDSGADYYCLETETGHHSGGESHGCEGAEYNANVTINDSPPRFYFQKQIFHGGAKYEHSTGKFTDSRVTEQVVGGGWKGFCVVRYNKKDGRSTGHDSVILEIWWNEDPEADITKWFMVKRIEDKGGWGKGGDTCDGVSDQIITWSNVQFRYKSGTPEFSIHPLIPEGEDDPNVHSIGEEDMSFEDSESRGYGKRADMPRDIEMKCLFKFASNNGICRLKNLSLREIDPNKTFDDDQNENPDTGETTKLKGFFKLTTNINTITTSACAGSSGGGGSGGSTKFYSVELESGQERGLSDHADHENRTRIAQRVINSSSPIKGKVIKQADVDLRKSGTPGASPTIAFKIWDSANIVKYTSTTLIDPSTLSTSFGSKTTFDCSSNTYECQAGDRIGVEYTGTSSSNLVYVAFSEAGGTGNTNSDMSQYESASWDNFSTRDVAMDLWE